MTDLVLVRPRSEEALRSPEFTYLASTVEASARSVCARLGEAWPGEAGAALLVVARENVHLGPASLERMKTAVDHGAPVAVATRLASFPLLEEAPPIYTLRGFERLERRLLDEGHEPRERSASHLPVALFAPTSAERLRGFSAEDLLSREDLLAETDLLDGAIHTGVYHDYIDYYGEVREDVLPLLGDGVRDVLEIGCGRGVTGALLQERLGCRVTGVELNPEVARDAERRLHRVLVGNVEELTFDERYDAVVATELFEHLNYPEAFLAKMREVVRPGGRIVLSVPNVGHYSIVEDLAAGRWDYLPVGLLCYTHFRFFTRATLESWLARTGFSEWEILAQTTELPERFRNLPPAFETDEESLRTKGFYVVVRV